MSFPAGHRPLFACAFAAAAALTWTAFNCSGPAGSPDDAGTDGGKACTSSSQCKPNEICKNRVCVPAGTCLKKSDCQSDEDCVGGKCVPIAGDGGEDGSIADGGGKDGGGSDGGGGCYATADCGAGYRCNLVTHECEEAAIISVEPPDLLNFGAVPYGEERTQKVTVTNKGKLTLSLTGFEVQNPPDNPCYRIVSGGTPAELNEDDYREITVGYRQNDAMPDDGKLRIASTDKDRGIYALTLRSAYKGLPKFSLFIYDPVQQEWVKDYPRAGSGYDYPIDFGYVAQGSIKSTVTGIRNITDGDAILSLVDFSAQNTPINAFAVTFREGADPSSKALPTPVQSNPLTHLYVGAGQMVYLHTDYDAVKKADTDGQDWKITTNDNDINGSGNPGTNSLTFKMTAKSMSSKIEVSPLTLDFGEIQKGTTAKKNVTITNNGDSDLRVLSTSGLKNKINTSFSTNPLTLEKTVAAKAKFIVEVLFSPASVSTETNYLVIDSDDGDSPKIEVTLSGSGTDPTLFVTTNPSTTGTPPVMDFGKVIKDTKTTGKVTVLNPGFGTLIVSNVILNQGTTDYFVLTGIKKNGNPVTSFPVSLAQQNTDTLTFDLELTPAILGTINASMVFKNNDAKHADYTILLTAISQINPGDTCQTAEQCSSGFCADGVCCNEKCDKSCQACNLSGFRGTCRPVVNDGDPKGICKFSNPSTCGQTGKCRGVEDCQLWEEHTICAGAQCSSNNQKVKPARECDGSGTCLPAIENSCAPYMCDPNLMVPGCRIACFSNFDCAPGFACDMNDQRCKLANGQACGLATECASGFCSEGVCCNEKCDKSCEACNLGTTVGVCTAVKKGDADPKSGCAAQDPSTCGTDGVCSGTKGLCEKWSSATVCKAAECSIDKLVSYNPKKCDGNGTCAEQGQTDCSPYVCDQASGVCRAFCTGNQDCIATAVCDLPDGGAAGICRLMSGQNCKSDSDCASGFCTGGVCCNERCGGTCETCTLQAYMGSCLAVPLGGDSGGKCAKDPQGTCKQTGKCSGARGTCQLYPENTVCTADTCKADLITHQMQSLCDGAGNCMNGGTENCTPFKCSNLPTPHCLNSCADSNECAPGGLYSCVDGVCGKKDGQPCTSGEECANRGCCGSVCTNIRTDKNNCGGCGWACGLVHASSTSCSAGICNPVCDAKWANCNSNPPDGCERDLASYPAGTGSSCAGPDDKGSHTGQTQYFSWLSCPNTAFEQFFSVSGTGSKWFKGSAVTSCALIWCSNNVEHRISFTVPAGITYRICTLKANCSATASCQDVTGSTYSTSISNAGDFSYYIKVEYVSGTSCGLWTLAVMGTKC